MNRVSPSTGTAMLRVSVIAAMTLGAGACANDPSGKTAGFAPVMMIGAATPVEAATLPKAADPIHELSRKSLAAKVLASRALETVTGLKTDPARLSEHD